ncbi:TonB-dependent receptor plug domain-containing protein [Paraflavitalea pollutisoli]|uniref:TonB-dependent receptor plug domain-containing protein n=1 Tax=Paraflavitalea pollutisoli TaxID=3034143 RepID=UPI0023ED0762|nr:TonB-dependent receptor plug domain-containing protein [Paraflavitalea sp. H1-2-19X]
MQTFIRYRNLTVHLQQDHTTDLLIERVAVTLQDVVITASESKGMTSASIIDRKAMQHLQPSSFTDLLELLPGGRAIDPNLTGINQIRLREVGISGNQYDISSLGTAFVIDGAPVNTTAALQTTGSYVLSSPNSSRSAVNKGVDMRTLSTDQIERVDIIRGIPSVEHGDLTSGVVQITRRKGASPYNARLKSDGFSKLVALGKGFFFPEKNLSLNIDFGYLDAKDEPTNNFETYQRINGSLRLEKAWERRRGTLSWSANLDLSSNIDNERVDPDNGFAPVDKYVSRSNNYTFGAILRHTTSNATSLVRSWELSGNISYTNSPLDQTKWVQPLSVGILFNATTAGDHDLSYAGGGYAANLKVDDQPLNAFFKAMTSLEFHTAGIKHQAKLGLETRYSKNLGDGQQYDLNYPPDPGGITVRPRAFNSIPAMLNQSVFAEDMLTMRWGNHVITTQAGIRAMSLLGMNSQYSLANKPYIDPRINIRWQLPRTSVAGKMLLITVGGGYGVQTKMPTLSQLYPNDKYDDIVQLNFYHNNPAYRQANAVTYITDRRNFGLAPAINYKWEVNSDLEWAGNRLSVTYFKETMSTGFRDITNFQVLAYKRYDTKSIGRRGQPDGPAADE